jgi:beta-lactamase superfamily II metal-dependent hydrolase
MYKRLFSLLGLFCGILLFTASSCKGDSSSDNNGGGTNPTTESGPGTAYIGEVLPPWEAGWLDIHAINTGRGESMFYIFPDGTTMLVDAAGSLLTTSTTSMPVDSKPNASITSGQVIADYVNHFIPAVDKGRLNYIVLTHYHSDHMGTYSTSVPQNSEGKYYVNGITEVGSDIPFDKMIVRGDPSVVVSKDMTNQEAIDNFNTFMKWAKTKYGATQEDMIVGSNEQVSMKIAPANYTSFSVRNIAANGYVWTGTGLESKTEIPSKAVLDAGGDAAAYPYENILSCVMDITYGKFNMFAGGDIQYSGMSTYPYMDIETPISKVVGPVDVMKACHHGTANANSSTLLGVLKPKVIVANVWRDVQPNAATLGRMYAASPTAKIYTTNLAASNQTNISAYLSSLVSTQGHVVIRVAPGGLKYYIFVLNDNNELYKIKSKNGPYLSE